MKLDTLYNIGNRVTMDNCKDLVGVITAVIVRGSPSRIVTYEVSWIHNGCSVAAWIEEWRLEEWDA